MLLNNWTNNWSKELLAPQPCAWGETLIHMNEFRVKTLCLIEQLFYEVMAVSMGGKRLGLKNLLKPIWFDANNKGVIKYIMRYILVYDIILWLICLLKNKKVPHPNTHLYLRTFLELVGMVVLDIIASTSFPIPMRTSVLREKGIRNSFKQSHKQ